MLLLVKIALILSSIYSAFAYIILAVQSVRTGADYERETFHLGLCFILAVGFLGLILALGG